MAKTRSLPDKFYDKDYEHNGIHRVPLAYRRLRAE